MLTGKKLYNQAAEIKPDEEGKGNKTYLSVAAEASKQLECVEPKLSFYCKNIVLCLLQSPDGRMNHEELANHIFVKSENTAYEKHV